MDGTASALRCAAIAARLHGLMIFELKSVVNWHPQETCTPTALAAISGQQPSTIRDLLRDAASQFGAVISSDPRPDYDINHWHRAVEMLGGMLIHDGEYSTVEFLQRPDMAQWFSKHHDASVKLAFCNDGEPPLAGHVFAAQGNCIVDTFTEGRKVTFTGVPAAYTRFRVKHYFTITSRNGL